MLGATIASTPGCVVGALVGGMMESYRRTGTRKVEAEYPELANKSVAVVVAADRVVQAEHPGLLARVTSAVSLRLSSQAGARVVNPAGVLEFLYNHPRWPALPYSELAKSLGAETLLVVDLYEFRLHEPGNAWLWEGRAAGRIDVIETAGALPDDSSFSRDVSVKFPDGSGHDRSEFTETQVLSVLTSRLIDRISWLFYDHQEPYYPDY